MDYIHVLITVRICSSLYTLKIRLHVPGDLFLYRGNNCNTKDCWIQAMNVSSHLPKIPTINVYVERIRTPWLGKMVSSRTQRLFLTQIWGLFSNCRVEFNKMCHEIWVLPKLRKCLECCYSAELSKINVRGTLIIKFILLNSNLSWIKSNIRAPEIS